MRVLHEMPRVLVVDDNAGAAEALATYLSYEGAEARAAVGCTEALRCVKDWVPDVVVLDIMMPERDGYETASALRSYLPTQSLGIVAFTSLDEDHVSLDDLFEGTFHIALADYIPKPHPKTFAHRV